MGTHLHTPTSSGLGLNPLWLQQLSVLGSALLLAVALLLQVACSSGGSSGKSSSAPPANLTYAANPATYTTGVDITPNHPSSEGGAVQSYAVAPSLPDGLVLDAGTGIITGRPNAITPETTYTVTALNEAGSASIDVLLRVNPPAPTITTQPSSQPISLGLAATFQVVASGTGPLSYQWQKNQADIATNATGATYTAPSSSRSDDGATFRVVVKDTYGGQVISQEATLGVLPGGVSPLQDLNVGRYGHAAVLLSDQRTLVLGGRSSGGPLATAEIYDSVTQTFATVAAHMGQARVSPTATLLSDGTVLILGGWNTAGFVASAEIFDPVSGTFAAVANLGHPRALHTATRLGDGTVVVIGGTDGDPVREIEIFDPQTSTFATTGSLNLSTPRVFHTASLLQDGTVLVAGGFGTASLASAEIYQPSPSHATDSVAAAPGALNEKRYLHTATVLANGNVLITGGIGAADTLASAEIFSPGSGFTATGNLKGKRQIHSATLLANGTVLIAGGWDGGSVVASFERFDPGTGVFLRVSGPAEGLHSHTATPLGDGKVLIVGGYNGAPLQGSALWEP